MPSKSYTVTVEITVSADDEEAAVEQVRDWIESHPQPQSDVVVRRVD